VKAVEFEPPAAVWRSASFDERLSTSRIAAMKKLSQLTIQDFESHPIWTWADEDAEDMVRPADTDYEEINSIFVLSDFWLNNGTHASGFMAVLMRNQQPYLAAINGDAGSFFDLPLNPHQKGRANIDQLEEKFNLRMEEIFPIKFYTHNLPFTGDRLCGEIENPESPTYY
jgi:hypothetical protein